MITNILNILHFIFIFLPIFPYFIKISIFERHIKWFLLGYMMTPLHWVYFDNQCLSTVIGKKLGDFKDTQTTSSFSETYLRWLYEPIMNIIGWEWNNKGLDKMITTHWIINITLIWYYCFYKL